MKLANFTPRENIPFYGTKEFCVAGVKDKSVLCFPKLWRVLYWVYESSKLKNAQICMLNLRYEKFITLLSTTPCISSIGQFSN